jgi:hypothetical protein
MAARHVRVVFREDVSDAGVRSTLPVDCEVIELTPRVWTLRVRGPLGSLLASIARLPVADMEVREPRLEEVLKTYYRDETPA